MWGKLCHSAFSWYWHCCTLISKCWHAAQFGQKILVWSQGFRLCDQEELPCCDICVKVPYQSHIRYSECGSTFAVPATHYCWVQMCLSMNYVFILLHYLRLLAPCCNPTNHLKQMPIHPSSIQIPQYVSYIYVGGALIQKQSMGNWSYLWVTVWKVYWVCKKIGPTKVLSVWWLLRWSFYKRQFSAEME